MLVKTQNKWIAARALLNTILKDNSFYCNWCNKDWNPKEFPCCEAPQVGRHIDHTKGIIKQNKEIRETRKNDYASNDDKTFRWGISLPPRVFTLWGKAFCDTYGEKLLKDDKDLIKFMKEFPEFRIPKKV